MKNINKKHGKASLLASVFMVFAFVAFAVGVPFINAQEVQEFPTYAFLSVAPNPVGVNQEVTVIIWLDIVPPTVAGAVTAWEGYRVNITKPDGSIETKGPYSSHSDGGYYFTYKPTKTGIYKFQFSFPGQTVAGVYYKPSKSAIVELTVQEKPIEAWPDTPLPTDYWERPINAENRLWYQIGGNWLMAAYDTMIRPFDTGGAFSPYADAPDSPHIVWTKELAFGGIVGGEFGYGANYYTGMSYEMKFTPPVVINGRLYYNIFQTGLLDPALSGVVCVDLRTGEEVWRREDMPQINLGQILEYNSPNQHGAFAYLWSTTAPEWQMYDAFTGRLLVKLQNATTSLSSWSTNAIFGPNGELLVYMLDGQNNRLIMWNSTKAASPAWLGFGPGSPIWRPGFIPVVDWRSGIQLNVSIPDVPGVQSNYFVSRTEGVILAESVIRPPGQIMPTFVHVAYNATTGAQLWVQNRTNMGFGYDASSPGLLWMVAIGGTQPREGVYVVFQKEKMQWHAFSLKTGEKLWSTEPLNKFTKTDWSMYDFFGQIAYGRLYVAGYSGCVSAFNLTTGAHLWTFSTGSSGLETPYGVWPLYGGITVADKKLYVSNGEHSPGSPMWKGEKLYCIDAITGDCNWYIPGWFVGNSLVVADGYLVGYNCYDNRLYCFGKTRSSTTVTASPKTLAKGAKVLIEGTVLDQSPAQPGTPCVSKQSMTDWMGYLHMQKACPSEVKGVSVAITAIKEDGSVVDLGTATTNGFYGTFSFAWTPPDEGTYTIIASFMGDESYGSSSAATAITVGPPPEEIEIPEYPTPTDYMPILIGIIIAIIIIVILVIYAIVSIRKLMRK